MSALTLKRNLKTLRAKKKLSQQKFADRINRPIKRYQAWEEGRSQPNVDDIIDIAKEHELTIDDLLTKDLVNKS